MSKKSSLMFNYIESIRGIAILAVLLVHTTAMGIHVENESIRYINIFLGQCAGFAVPLFVMISGYVLSISNYKYLNTKDEIKNFYLRRMKKILIPYIFFSMIFSILSIPFGHFWFFNLILYLYLLYPVLISKKLNLLITSLILIFLAYILEYFVYFSGVTIHPIFHPKYILYMWMGILLYRYESFIYSWIDKYKVFLICLYLMIMLMQTTLTFFYENSYLYIQAWSFLSLTSISIIILLIFYFISQGFFSKKVNEKLYFLGDLSFGIYIIHIVFLVSIKWLLLQIMTKNDILVYIIIFGVSLACSILFIKVLRRFKIGAYILSEQYIKGKK